LGNIDTAVLQPGDMLAIRSAGGGGRGNPLEREPWRVAQDVLRGYLSPAAAERDYGVVLCNGEVDEQATEQSRAGKEASAGHFHFGPERDGYEAQWTPAAYDRLHAVLDALPIHWRFFAKTEIFRRMKGRAGPEGVRAAFDAVCERFPELPRPRSLQEAAE
ncbi:hydantoin utilization protein B, partial [Mesorhizobium sp. M2D.F.Ca.ET.145.01.1.1]